MIVAVFRSRLIEENADGFHALADRMEEIARSLPGFISYKDYISEDSERVSIHEWESAEHLRAWREHPEHSAAQAKGREAYYEDYTLYVLDEPRESRFRREE